MHFSGSQFQASLIELTHHRRTICYLRQVKLEPQNRIYSNEALSGEKRRGFAAHRGSAARHGPAARRSAPRCGLDALRRPPCATASRPGRKPVGDIRICAHCFDLRRGFLGYRQVCQRLHPRYPGCYRSTCCARAAQRPGGSPGIRALYAALYCPTPVQRDERNQHSCTSPQLEQYFVAGNCSGSCQRAFGRLRPPPYGPLNPFSCGVCAGLGPGANRRSHRHRA